MLSGDQETTERFNRLARMVGRVFGTDVGVDESGDRLIFVDVNGDPITIDGEEIIAATLAEITSKNVGDFAARALRAAMMLKYQEMERSRTP